MVTELLIHVTGVMWSMSSIEAFMITSLLRMRRMYPEDPIVQPGVEPGVLKQVPGKGRGIRSMEWLEALIFKVYATNKYDDPLPLLFSS